ncbi:MAG: LemA family protein [Bacilli bacterium]|nr:LemA family protein [Bacilli bacterium]
MANEIDEVNGPIKEEGRDIHVIDKQIPVKVGPGSMIFEVVLWVAGIIPGLIFFIMKIKAQNYLRALQQKVQHDASTIDNYLEQRVLILQNCARILDKAISLDKDTMTQIAAYRGGANPNNDALRNDIASKMETVANKINIAAENYPTLQAHSELADAMQQNSYLQKEITAAREVYNDTVGQWNRDIFQWPVKMIVAAKAGYTSRIPFSISNEMREKAKGTFF